MNKDGIKLLFVQEAVYLEYKGELYSSRIRYENYWDRFLDHFEHVTVLARTRKVNDLPSGYHRSTGMRVGYIPLDYYHGLTGYLKKRKSINNIIEKNIFSYSAFVLRVPSKIGGVIFQKLKRERYKYAVEVVGDPYEVGKFLPLILPLRILYRYRTLFQMRKIIDNSFAALYVTEKTLQKRYPPNEKAFYTSASDVFIPDEQFSANKTGRKNILLSLPHRLYNASEKSVKIGVVGMIYAIKSPLDIVRAAKLLIDSGLNIEVNFVGDGPMMEDVIKLAFKLNIGDRIICRGTLTSGDEVFNFLDSIDLYIQFSKTEGMPRSVLEAMSRGCPVIASKVGGIPELIPDDLLVKSGDYKALANKISWLLNDCERIKKASKDNILKAEEYLDSRLRGKRHYFYSKVYSMYSKN